MRGGLGAGGLGAVLCGGGLIAGIAAAAAPPVAVTDARLRVLLPSLPAAGYFTLANHGDRPLDLVGAASPACGGGVMLHHSAENGGLSSMSTETHVALPARGTLRFAPGGYHLMCMAPRATPGGRVAVTLSFAGGPAVTVPFRVVGAHG